MSYDTRHCTSTFCENYNYKIVCEFDDSCKNGRCKKFDTYLSMKEQRKIIEEHIKSM